MNVDPDPWRGFLPWKIGIMKIVYSMDWFRGKSGGIHQFSMVFRWSKGFPASVPLSQSIDLCSWAIYKIAVQLLQGICREAMILDRPFDGTRADLVLQPCDKYGIIHNERELTVTKSWLVVWSMFMFHHIWDDDQFFRGSLFPLGLAQPTTRVCHNKYCSTVAP